MKTSPITLTVESISHDEFMAAAQEIRKHLNAGDEVILAVAPGVSAQSVQSLLIGRYITDRQSRQITIVQK